MKKFVFVMLIVCFAFIGATIALAGEHSVSGVKVDAPNLVTITDDWTLGAEGGKDIIADIFRDDTDYLEADKGYFAYVKVTYTGCLVNCAEEKTAEVTQ